MTNPAGYNVPNVQKPDGTWEIHSTLDIKTATGGVLKIDGADVSAGLEEIANLSGLSSTETGFLDGATTTATASKVVVCDANKDVATLRDVTLRGITATGAVTGVTDLSTTGNAALGNAAGDTFKVHGTAESGAQSALIAQLGAFTDPPSAAEMATLRTAVNGLLTCLVNHGLMAAS